ncbi:MAG TPA: helix-turn-helix transcriptional regulator [Roseateles sp.]
MPETFAPVSESFAPPSTVLAKLQLSPPAGPGGRHHVAGLVEMTELKPGLIVQRMRVRDLEDRETQGTVLPGLKIGLVVGGKSDLWLGNEAFQLGPQAAGPSGGMLVSVAEPDGYRRHAHRGQDEHKLILTLLPEWLEEQSADDAHSRARIQAFCARHLARLYWQPSSRAISLAHQIVHAPAQRGLIDRLYMEARTIEIVAEALGAIVGESPPDVRLNSRDHRRLRELQAQLDAGVFDDSSLAQIARSIGMSASSLQRHFKAFAGQGLFDYMRGRRLEQARYALERQGLNVGQAAAMAGYGNAANFSTAFKRRFGFSPRSVRSNL